MNALLLPAILALPSAPDLTFEPTRFVTRAGEEIEAERGRLVVPADPARPGAGTLELALVRFRSASPAPGPPIVYLAGGPGGSAIELARGPRAPLFQALREHGDVLALDPRGSGSSEPDLSCGTTAELPFDRPVSSEALVAAYLEGARACAAELAARGIDLSLFRTERLADDVEELRRALGVPRLVLVGMSYGTHTGLAFLRRHPASVARAVLAGVEGPDHTLKLPGTLDRHLADVAELVAADPVAGARFPDLVGSLRRVFERLADEPLRVPLEHPDTGQTVEVPVGAFEARLVTFFHLSDRDGIASLPALVARLEAGDPSGLAPFATLLRRIPISAMAGVVDCVSGASPGRLERIAREAAASLLGDAANVPFPAGCEAWGVAPAPASFRAPVTSDVPTLFLSGTLDGRTPPENAEEVAAGFTNAAHVVVEGAGHDSSLLVTPGPLEAIHAFLRGEAVASHTVALPPLELAPLPAPPEPRESSTPPALLIEHVTVVDVAAGASLADHSVLIRGERIVRVSPSAELAATELPPGIRRVDGTGRFLIPGLWDAHVHVCKVRRPALPLFLWHGVTSVRDTGGELAELLEWRRAIEAGELDGPRILTAGPYLEAAANVARMIAEDTVEPVERARRGIAHPDEARRVVAEVAASGVDFLKIRTFASRETYFALAEAAAEAGLPLFGHAFGLTPDDVVRSGMRSVEHGFYPPLADLEPAARRAACARLAASGTVYVPTLAGLFHSVLLPYDEAAAIVEGAPGAGAPWRAYLAAYTLADWREQLAEKEQHGFGPYEELIPKLVADARSLHEADVPFLAGSDTAILNVWPGASLHDELELLVSEVGLTPLEALAAATTNPAELLGLAADLGRIRPGYLADLVLLDADPLRDVAAVRTVRAVVHGGVLYDEEARAVLLERASTFPELEIDDWKKPARSSTSR